MSDEDTLPEEERILNVLRENTDALEALLSMPTHKIEQIVADRREEIFSALWEEMNMDKNESLEMIKERENQLLDVHDDHGVPEFLLRMDAQEMIAEMLIEDLNNEL